MAEDGRVVPSAAAVLFATSPDVVVVVRGDDFRIEWANPPSEALAGRGVVGELYRDAFPGAAERLAEHLDSAHRSGRAFRQSGVPFEVESPTGARTTRYLDILFQPFDDGRPGIALVGTDNTEHHRREEGTRFIAEAARLLASSLDFETTLQTLAELAVPRLADWCAVEIVREDGSSEQLAVAHSDPEKVRYARALRERYPPDPDAPHGVPHVLRTGQPEIYIDVPEAMVRAGARDEEHLRISLALGLRSAIIVPLVARGRVLGAFTLVYAESGRRFDDVAVDVAEEIAARAAIAVDNARLYGEAQRAIRVRDDFLSVASHELRTPLTSMHLLVGGVLRKLDRGDDVDPQRLRRLDGQLARLAALIDQLLDVARLNAGRFQLHAEDVRLGDLLEDVVDRFREEATARGVTLSLDGAADLVGRWDAQRLDQVFTNLLSNALKYGDGTPIVVRAERDGDKVRVLVEDHGPGIAEGDLERIFERFERAASSRKHGGLGLGLWIARQMVEAHAGSLCARSVPGDGATFVVELPVLSEEGRA